MEQKNMNVSIGFNTSFIPTHYDIDETYDYSIEPNPDLMDLLTVCKTGSRIEKKCGSCSWFYQEMRDIIIESNEDIEISLSCHTFYCQKGKHFFSRFFFRSGRFDIAKNQKYTLYVLSNTDVERTNLFKAITPLLDSQFVYIDGLYGTDEQYIGCLACYFGAVPIRSRKVSLDVDWLFERDRPYLSKQQEIETDYPTYHVKIQHPNLHELLEDDNVNNLFRPWTWEFLSVIPSTLFLVKEEDFDELKEKLAESYSLSIVRPPPNPVFRNKTEEEIREDERQLRIQIRDRINQIHRFANIGYILMD